MTRQPINPKRIALVRDFRMLDEADWPDDMPLEKLWQFCLITGFEIGFFRGDDPPELEIGHCCSSIGELSEEEWQRIMEGEP